MICCIWQIRRKTWNNRKGKRMSISRMVYTGTSYFGEYAREKIAEEVSKRHFRKALLISDKALEACGITGKIEEVLKKNGIPYTLFDEVKPNPTIENVRAGLACYKNSGSDFILAVGGGSVIDTAKAVAVTANNPENEDIVSLEGMDKSKNPAVPLIAVPTTAGTGSETTMISLLPTRRKSGKWHAWTRKWCLRRQFWTRRSWHPFLFPLRRQQQWMP